MRLSFVHSASRSIWLSTRTVNVLSFRCALFLHDFHELCECFDFSNTRNVHYQNCGGAQHYTWMSPGDSLTHGSHPSQTAVASLPRSSSQAVIPTFGGPHACSQTPTRASTPPTSTPSCRPSPPKLLWKRASSTAQPYKRDRA